MENNLPDGSLFAATPGSLNPRWTAEHVCERSGPEPVSCPVPPREAAVGVSGSNASVSAGREEFPKASTTNL